MALADRFLIVGALGSHQQGSGHEDGSQTQGNP
jgi:hypothetical protein